MSTYFYSTWVTTADTSGFCQTGSKECATPIYPDCQDRTMKCVPDLPVHETMQRQNLSTNFSETPHSLGALYSYTCKEDGWLIQTPGYPEEVIGKSEPDLFMQVTIMLCEKNAANSSFYARCFHASRWSRATFLF